MQTASFLRNIAPIETAAAYRAQRWAVARENLIRCRDLAEGFALDGFYDVYDRRNDQYESNPPPPDWDGVTVAATK